MEPLQTHLMPGWLTQVSLERERKSQSRLKAQRQGSKMTSNCDRRTALLVTVLTPKQVLQKQAPAWFVAPISETRQQETRGRVDNWRYSASIVSTWEKKEPDIACVQYIPICKASTIYKILQSLLLPRSVHLIQKNYILKQITLLWSKLHARPHGSALNQSKAACSRFWWPATFLDFSPPPFLYLSLTAWSHFLDVWEAASKQLGGRKGRSGEGQFDWQLWGASEAQSRWIRTESC